MDRATLDRLEARARLRNERKSRTAERLIDEGLRMEDHPGVVFRDGPTGRRAALAIGPDVWEVIDTIKNSGLRGDEAVAAAAEWGNLSPVQVRAAVAYYAEYPAEIDDRIQVNSELADKLRTNLRRAQDILG